MNDVDLRQLRYFLAVARERSFTRAAATLTMTQPALSRAIRDLEHSIGVELFVRGHRDVRLTAAGRVLFDDARGLDEQARAALTRAARAGHDRTRLRVSARGCEIKVLDHLVQTYNARFPAEQAAEAAMVNWQDQTDALRSGQDDVGLLRRPFDDRGLDSELLWSEPRVTLLSVRHPLASRATINRAELAGEAIAVWAEASADETAHWAGTDLEHHHWLPGPPIQDLAQLTGNVRLARTIAFAPLSLLNEPLPAGIVAVPTHGLSDSQLHVAWPARATSPDIARFVRHAIAHASDLHSSAAGSDRS
ncbi:LysR family transcriptional regulator [Rugosimonospora acidiphila]|uniref:LysR family transcriptional regulator n=1 Tax=Rugosimonospora acidiphila TaxID=556531 RepID=A0ABP9S9J4_9ACTN